MKSYIPYMVAFFLLLCPTMGHPQQTVEELYSKGVEAVKEKKYEEAIQSFNETLMLRPDYESAYYQIGLVYSMRGMWDESIEAYRKAVEINPRNSEARYGLGYALYKNEMLDEATEVFKTVIGQNSGLFSAYQALGAVYATSKSVEEAIPLFRKALELSPNDRTAHWNLAEAYAELGKGLLAADHYYQVGILSLAVGDREGALAAYEKARALSPAIGDVLLKRLYPESTATNEDVGKDPQVVSRKGPHGDSHSDSQEGPGRHSRGDSRKKAEGQWYSLRSKMKVRKGPTTKSKVLSLLDRGSRFKILGRAPEKGSNNTWFQIQGESGIEGWLCGINKGVVQYEAISGP